MTMVKKLIFILLSLAIVITGAFAFRKLNYWERSVYIFDYKEMDRRFEGRGGRRPAEFSRSREASDGRGDRGADRELRERPEREFRENREGRSSFGPDDRGGDGRGHGHGRGDFHGGKQIRLRNILWFLAVFSAFTVVSVYLDRIWLRIRKQRQSSTH